ncbi:acyl-CoA carboxylase subunit epsilon [Allorhizocola rhizosphaerae]|uniref:acyl-CoA carboxylase subunit epsilon n=1 Tax=Allorhizocola rhizosphaerae TaxID=1872709 RepID=UPI000E3E1E9C|nr:acyl-CoA carboxylase subunit epsilon [Allorhizocola rhizosphaerae]
MNTNLRIEKGTPTAEEIAALVGVLAGLPPSSTSEAPRPVSAWWRSGLPAPRGSWRESALPTLSHR